MKVSSFIWLDEIVEKLVVKHHVVPDEVEQVFENRPNFKRWQRGHLRGEDMYQAVGQTEAGRYLVIFFTYKQTGEALVISARDMDRKERKSYGR
jgi:uncharacterized DUF497 family protein